MAEHTRPSVSIAHVTFTFRLITRADFGTFAGWLTRPHVERWFHDPATVEFVAREYGSDPKTLVHIAELDGRPIGFLQSYIVGIEAVSPVIDGGGNIARLNGNLLQCTGVLYAAHR